MHRNSSLHNIHFMRNYLLLHIFRLSLLGNRSITDLSMYYYLGMCIQGRKEIGCITHLEHCTFFIPMVKPISMDFSLPRFRFHLFFDMCEVAMPIKYNENIIVCVKGWPHDLVNKRVNQFPFTSKNKSSFLPIIIK